MASRRAAFRTSPATRRAIRASVEEASKSAGVFIRSAFIGVTGAHVSFENRRNPVRWIGERGVITADDLERVPQEVASAGADAGRKVLHAIPMSYSLDGGEGIRNPLGMHTRYVEVETHVVTGASSLIDKLVEAVEGAGLTVEQLVLEPLASGEAVLSPQERAQEVALVDIGGGTTDLVLFRNGTLCHTAVIPVGGHQFTNDICVTYNTPYEAAEAAKLRYADTDPFASRTQEEVSLPVSGRKIELRVQRSDLCQLARERAQELVRLIQIKLQEAEIADITRLRMVLTGGTANLPGLKEMVQRTLTKHVRVGVPDGRGGIPDEFKRARLLHRRGYPLVGDEQSCALDSRGARVS